MGITGVPFGPIEMKPVPKKTHDRALAQGKGSRGLGTKRFKKKCKIVTFVDMFKLFRKNVQSRNRSDLLELR